MAEMDKETDIIPPIEDWDLDPEVGIQVLLDALAS